MRREAPMVVRGADGARSLAALMHDRLGYEGERGPTYNEPRNANLGNVIDRRRGLPVALGVLYINAARAAGMKAEGLNTQGHFVISITHLNANLPIDPVNSGMDVDGEHMP